MRLLIAVLLCMYPVTASAQEETPLTDQIEVVDILPTRPIAVAAPASRVPLKQRRPASFRVGVRSDTGSIRDPFAYGTGLYRPNAVMGTLDACASSFCLRVERTLALDASLMRTDVRLNTHLIGRRPSLGLTLEGQRTSWYRATLADSSFTVGVSRLITSSAFGVEFGWGRRTRTSPRITVLSGFADSRSDSQLTIGTFGTTEALSRSASWFAGARLEGGVMLPGNIAVIGELSCASPLDPKEMTAPANEWSARLTVDAPVWKRFGAFGTLRVAPAAPALSADSSFGFGLRWVK